MKSKDKFEIAEEEILKSGLLRLLGFLKKDLPEELRDFLILFFEQLKDKYDTVTADKHRKYVTGTYKNRSTGEVFQICKYYFPDITFKEYIKTLGKLAKDKEIESFICDDIEKRVWYSGSDGITNSYYQSELDHGLTINDYK